MDYEKMDCPVCSRPFFDPYDVVCCPVCGAPHHRACWAESGHCHFADKHDTPEQWSAESSQHMPEQSSSAEDSDFSGQPQYNENAGQDAFFGSYRSNSGSEHDDDVNYCSKCGAKVTSEMDYCEKCGNQLRGAAYSPMPVLPVNYGFSGIEYEEDGGETIEEIPVKELKLFIRTKSDFYISKFRNIFNNKKKVDWNFSAFFFSKSWLLYRRIITPFIIIAAITYILAIPLIMSMVHFYSDFITAAGGTMTDLTAVYDVLYDPIKTNEIVTSLSSYNAFILWFEINAAAQLVIHFVIGLLGNVLYGKHCIKTVGQLRAQSDVKSQQYKTNLFFRGGTRATLPIIYFIFAYMLFNFSFSLFA